MPLYDATIPLRNGLVSFPGDPIFRSEPFFVRDHDNLFNLTELHMGTHSGTHVDAPSHRLDSTTTVDDIPLDVLVGPGVVLDMRGKSAIDRTDLESSDLKGCTRVLFKTDSGPSLHVSEFQEDYVYLTEDAASYLVELGVQLIGIDYLSIEKKDNPGAPVHRALLEAEILVVEGVDLLKVPTGRCEIFCLPLKIQGADGAPARVLIKTDGTDTC
jgi:arylformamidase